MLTYWMLLIAPAMVGAFPVRLDRYAARIMAILAGLLLILVIGGRDQVGCDWLSYLDIYDNVLSQRTAAGAGAGAVDPGYTLVNWFCQQLDLGVYGVNLICAAIFTTGLFLFCRRQPIPWLTFIASVPMLIVVVAMGFTRQATAIGFLMLAMNALEDRKPISFLVFVAAGATFHKTAVVFAPFLPFVIDRRLSLPFLVMAGASVMLVFAYLSTGLDHLFQIYVSNGMWENERSAALPRLGFNLLAAIGFFLFRRKWEAACDDGRLYTVLSLVSIGMFPFLYLEPVAADRVGMYLLPYQAAVFSRLPVLLGRRTAVLLTLLIVLCEAAVMVVWFRFANNSNCWIPYRSFLYGS